MNKEQLRLELGKTLHQTSEQLRAQKSEKACQNLISTSQFQDASMVMIYLSLPHEADTSQAIFYAWDQNKVIVVPKVSWQQKEMMPVRINNLNGDLSPEVSGLRNPTDGEPVQFEDIDLIVAPGLGFDKTGNRLGRGGGYYDRFLANDDLNAQVCGFGFAEQIVDTLPVTETDVPMDFMVTDENVIYFNNSEQGV